MKISVNKNKVEITERDTVNSGEVNVTKCKFDFSEEYDELIKVAVFSNLYDSYKVPINSNNECNIASEILEDNGKIKIGVYAYEVEDQRLILRYSPSPTFFEVESGSYIKKAKNSIDLFEKVLADYKKEINELDQKIDDFEDSKVDKEEGKELSTNDFTDAYKQKLDDIEEGAEENIIEDVKVNGTSLEVTNKSVNVEIPTSLSDLTEDSTHRTVTDIEKSNWNEKVDIDVNNLTNYELKTNTGSTIELSINSSTYVMTLNLKNSAGTTISTGTIDLPLETMVVNASYDSTTKEIVLTLQSGSTVRFSVADLVSGLQSEITSSNKLSSDLVDDTNSINKFTNATEKSKLNGIEAGAEVNIIEDIKVNGTSQSVTNKSVDISIPTNTVSSTNVRTILSLTQAEYDNITTPDTNTMYVIKEA